MPIIANIVKPGTRKETQEVKQKPLVSLKNIHEAHKKKNVSAAVEKPTRLHTVKEQDEINIKKTSRYLEDLTNIGDN